MINQYHKVAALTGNSKLLVVDIVALLEDGKVTVTKCEQVGRRQLAACMQHAGQHVRVGPTLSDEVK